MNCQLYRTDVMLSGQVRYDLILGSSGNDLYIRDFRMRPVSDQVLYPGNRTLDEMAAYNTNQDNIRILYDTIGAEHMFNPLLPYGFQHDFPLTDVSADRSICNEYIAGCRRTDPQYREQFEVLCPLWIENADGVLYFDIIISSGSKTIGSRRLVLDNKKYDFHNRFVKYIYDYFDYISPDDKLIYADIKNKVSNIHGLEVSSGNIVTKKINLIDNIIYREIPVMETDNMIISSFGDNNIIAKQMFNFCLCFNIDDILSSFAMSSMKGARVCISVSAGMTYNGEDHKFDIYDFSSNYDHMPRKCTSGEDMDINIYDYMRDNKYVKYMNRNKYSQDIIHWSLAGNNDYIFNLYDGFSGYMNDGDITYHNHSYMDAPDISKDIYDPSYNNTGWCEHMDYPKITEIRDVISDYVKYEAIASDFTKGWVKNIMYKTPVDIRVLLSICSEQIYDDASKLGMIELTEDIYNIKYIVPNKDKNFIYIIAKDNNSLVFNNVSKLISNVDNVPQIDLLQDVFINAISPDTVRFSNTLDIINADSPSIDTDEIEYHRTSGGSYVMRYSGFLKPHLVKEGNYIYTKKIMNTDDLKDVDNPFNKYYFSDYSPLFPSIGFCAWNKSSLTYDKAPDVLSSAYEYKWYGVGRHYILDTYMDFTLRSQMREDGTYVPVRSLIMNYISTYYKVSDQEASYIMNLYDINVDYEYESEYNIYNYIYKIKAQIL